jgi:hypothetical protein
MQPVEFRASIVSPITWTLIVLVFGWPLSALLCLPARAIWTDDVFMILTLVVTLIWLALIWIYFMTLRVTFGNGHLVKASLLRTTTVVLNEKTLIRHRAEQTVVEGINVSKAFAGSLGQEATTHIQITVRDATKQIKVGSALKGICKLRDSLIAFEAETILPALLKRLQLGEKVVIDPFEFQNVRVTYGSTSDTIPLASKVEVKAGSLHFQLAGKKKRLALKKVWNPVTCLRLLSEGAL